MLVGLTIVGLLTSKSVIERPAIVTYFVELNGIRLKPMTPALTGTQSKGNVAEAFWGGPLTAIYPNGTTFTPQDLVNPSVLQVVA